MGESSKAEASVFDGLTDLLRGFKEVRMNRPRADGLLRDLAEFRRPPAGPTSKPRRKGQNFAVIEAMFYTLIGLTASVVPLFGTDYYTVVVPATTAALFIVGPVRPRPSVVSMITQADMALSNIEAMEDRLSDASHGAPADGQGRSAGPVPEKPTTIALRNAVFTHCDAKGKELFTVGPLSAEFRAGEITFVTGGNGSGKSTMLKLLIGLIPLKEGTLLVDGQPVMAEQMQDYRDRISAIFSDYHLSRRLYDMHAADPASILEHLKEMEMQSKVTVSDGAFSTVDLSTGQRKRLALVVAMLEDKQVIVLDEWAADQDPEFREVFYTKLLPKLKEQNKIVICVSHDDTWFKSKKPQINMKDGRIVHALPD